MPVQTQVVRFQKSTGANGTTQDVNLTFTPKAIIVTSAGSATEGSAQAEYQNTVGFSDGTNHFCIAQGSDDGSAVADLGKRVDTTHVFARVSQTAPANTTICTGTCAFASNKVTFTWDLNDAVATWITVFAVGGDDITNVKVGVKSNTTITNGATEDYTGLGWNPAGNGNSVLFILHDNSSIGTTTYQTGNIRTSFGCAVSSSQQWATSEGPETGADPTDTWRVHFSNRVLVGWDGAGLVNANASFNAWITDGFRLTWNDAQSVANIMFGYMVIEGGTWDAGNITTPTTATNDVDTAVSVSSRTIKGLLLSTVGTTTSGTVATETIYSIGVTDGTNHDVQSSIDEDNQATSDSYRFTSSTSVVYLMTLDGVLTDRATFDSFSSNNFRLDYPTKSANAQLIGWVVVANTTADAVAVEDVFSHSYGNIHQMYDNNQGPAIFG